MADLSERVAQYRGDRPERSDQADRANQRSGCDALHGAGAFADFTGASHAASEAAACTARPTTTLRPEDVASIARKTADVARVLRMPPQGWTAQHLQSLGVEATTATVLISHLRNTPLMSSEFLVHTIDETIGVESALLFLGDGLDKYYAHAYQSEAGDGAAVAVSIGQAIVESRLGGLPRSSDGKGSFVRGLLDLFSARTHLSPTGTGNVATALSILLECGARCDAGVFDSVPPLIYALSRHVPARVLDVLIRHGADPNEALACADAIAPTWAKDFRVGATAMHHAAFVGSREAMAALFTTHGGRLDIATPDGYTPVAVAGATPRPMPGPCAGLIARAISARDAWISTDTDPVRRRANGELLAEVLTMRLLEADRSATTAELEHWLRAMDGSCADGCDVISVLDSAPAHGGPTYRSRIYDMFLTWYGGNSREGCPVMDEGKIEAAVCINEWMDDHTRYDIAPNARVLSHRRIMRATLASLPGDPVVHRAAVAH
ncbi:hypothetical protein [Pandoraea captiosa]|nr:hypothetical protein [Pandoraea captiosa]